MSKLGRYIKNNPLILPPAGLFTAFLVSGLVARNSLLIIIASIFLIILIIGVTLNLRRYK